MLYNFFDKTVHVLYIHTLLGTLVNTHIQSANRVTANSMIKSMQTCDEVQLLFRPNFQNGEEM